MITKFFNVVFIALLIGWTTGCSNASQQGDDHEHGHGHDHGHEHEGEEAHGHEDGEITLEPERVEQLGVVCVAATSSSISPTVKVTGEVIADASAQAVVVAPSAGVVTFAKGISEGIEVRAGQRIASVSDGGMTGGDANRSAEINLNAAKAELERLKPLREAGIITVQEYTAALQAYEQALNARGTTSGQATSPVSGIITSILVPTGTHVDHGATLATVSTSGALMIRADVPVRMMQSVAGSTRAVITPAGSDKGIDAQIVSGKPTVAQGGYMPLYFSVAATDANLFAPGTYVDVAILTPTVNEAVVTVPLTALAEKMGEKFVYVRLDDECYEARPVTVGADDGRFIEIKSGLKPGEEVVSEGVIYLRLAENAGAAIPAHSHEH